MDRRTFGRATAAWAVAGTGAAGLLSASGAFAQVPSASNYVRLSTPVPQNTKGKIEVVEFFWYGCPHCNAFEPHLEAWAAKLPADVTFRRIHVGFRPNIKVHQKFFYALEVLGKVDAAMQKEVFDLFHVKRQPIDTPEAGADFMAKFGVDRTKFIDAFNSFTVQTRCNQANKLVESFKIDGVPTLGIGGRYTTSESLNDGSAQKTLATADYLIAQVRKEK